MEAPKAHRTTVAQPPKRLKWKTVIALILLLMAIFFNWSWVFGLLFIAWAISDMISGRIYFVEEIVRAENPFLFWTMAILWLLMGSYLLVEPWLLTAVGWD